MAETTPTECTLNELDPRLSKQVTNAQKNLKKNPAYAIDLCRNILSHNPGCVDVRKLLHEAYRHKASGTKSGFGKLLKSVTRTPFAIKGGSQAKKDPLGALQTADKMIGDDPTGGAGYKLLGEAATTLKFHGTAILAYEDLRKVEEDDLNSNLALAQAYLDADRPKEALALADAIGREHPGNEPAAEIIRKGSVAITMQKGKYDTADSFRESLADESTSIELEQAARTVNDAETQASIIEKTLVAIENAPDDINLYRKLIDTYKAKGDYGLAADWVDKARATPNGRGDNALERLGTELREREKSELLAKKEAELEKTPSATLQAEIEGIKAELTSLRLANARQMVERYPNDFMARFKLGELLLQSGDYDGAISEFQLSQRNPQVRVKSVLLTGRAMLNKGMADLAVAQLETAKSETAVMNDLKKEILYELASAHEAAGNQTAAIEEYKTIYQADIGFRDVSDKINAFYASKTQ